MSLCMVNPFLVEKYQETDLKRFFNKYSIATVLSKTFFRNSLVTSKTIKVLHHYYCSITFLEQLLFFAKILFGTVSLLARNDFENIKSTQISLANTAQKMNFPLRIFCGFGHIY